MGLNLLLLLLPVCFVHITVAQDDSAYYSKYNDCWEDELVKLTLAEEEWNETLYADRNSEEYRNLRLDFTAMILTSLQTFNTSTDLKRLDCACADKWDGSYETWNAECRAEDQAPWTVVMIDIEEGIIEEEIDYEYDGVAGTARFRRQRGRGRVAKKGLRALFVIRPPKGVKNIKPQLEALRGILDQPQRRNKRQALINVGQCPAKSNETPAFTVNRAYSPKITAQTVLGIKDNCYYPSFEDITVLSLAEYEAIEGDWQTMTGSKWDDFCNYTPLASRFTAKCSGEKVKDCDRHFCTAYAVRCQGKDRYFLPWRTSTDSCNIDPDAGNPTTTTEATTTTTTTTPPTTSATTEKPTTTTEDVSPLDGQDAWLFCCKWAAVSDCNSNKVFMRTVCQKSCGTTGCRAETIDGPKCQPKLAKITKQNCPFL